MVLYGIASAVADDIVEWFSTRAQAEAILAEIPRGEADFALDLWVEPVEFE